MRNLLFAVASTALVACAASPADEPGKGGGGGGGKADGVTSSCPVDGDADKIMEAIEGGGNCYTAAGIAEACAWGSSIDVQFVAAATEVCSGGFDAMPAAMMATYDSLVSRCYAKYENESGTLYRSAASFCALQVTHLFSTLYPAADTPDPVVSFSAECPVDSGDPEDIDAAIRRAPACSLAADVAESCAWGSSIDVQFVAAASEQCSTDAMTDSDKASRDGLLTACEDHYADEGGTLGLSMTAFCGLQVEVVFDSLYSEVE